MHLYACNSWINKAYLQKNAKMKINCIETKEEAFGFCLKKKYLNLVL
jgi:hypothetical protein